MNASKHEAIKKEVSEAVEAAAICLINVNESGDRVEYQRRLNEITSQIHQLYMQVYMVEQTENITDISGNKCV